MYIIAGMILLIYLVLWAVSRRLAVEGKGLRPMLRMGTWVYEKAKNVIGEGIGQGRIRSDLEKLYPGDETEKLITQYYAEKLGLILIIILAGVLLGTVVSAETDLGRILEDGNVVERGDYRKSHKELKLEAVVEGYPKQSFQLEVNGRVPDRDTADQLEEEFWELLMEEALGENTSWDAVYQNLKLQESLEGYPFTVEWFSDSLAIVDHEGNVKALSRGEEERVMLTAVITYHDWEWSHTMEVTVVPTAKEEELLHLELEELLAEEEKESRSEELFTLPDKWQGKEIQWSEHSQNNGLILFLMALAVGASVFFLKDKDLNAKVQDRQKQLKNAYPGILHKLELYLRAGLTIRGALARVAEMYLQGRQEGREEQPAYEEVLHACRELQMGIAEAKVYERLGVRCGLQEYVRLGALLTQNTVKGSGGLTDRLSEEAETVRKEQIQRSRQLGEEASTRLLVPMVMMLGIVMVMIMIPAFGSY